LKELSCHTQEVTKLPVLVAYRRALNFTQTVIKQIPIPVLGDRALSGMFGREGDKVTREWRKIHHEDLNDMNTSPNIVRVIK
jgi:hypothetical protein